MKGTRRCRRIRDRARGWGRGRSLHDSRAELEGHRRRGLVAAHVLPLLDCRVFRTQGRARLLPLQPQVAGGAVRAVALVCEAGRVRDFLAVAAFGARPVELLRGDVEGLGEPRRGREEQESLQAEQPGARWGSARQYSSRRVLACPCPVSSLLSRVSGGCKSRVAVGSTPKDNCEEPSFGRCWSDQCVEGWRTQRLLGGTKSSCATPRGTACLRGDGGGAAHRI